MDLYYRIFTANYTNNSGDEFEIRIQSREFRTAVNISAYADLSYKDVDNILEPIRGAQLDININASITKPFDLFLDFEEGDFKAELYRNGIKLFEGFINPEGVTQDFTSEFWVCRLTAVDNLASLKNKNLKYDNQLPSEFVLMDLCLKETGLDLPIAFFDDINNRVLTSNGDDLDYGKRLDNGDRERIVDPLVFKNDNGRFVSCDEVLQDILNKYNAFLIMQSIQHSGGTDLCWVFFRPAVLYKGYGLQQIFNVKRINSYQTKTQNGFVNTRFPVIETLGKVNPKTYYVGTKDNMTIDPNSQFNNEAYYKNSNQLIRQSRALQNFRFEQYWIERPTVFDFDVSKFSPLSPNPASLFFNSINDFKTSQVIKYESIEIPLIDISRNVELLIEGVVTGNNIDVPRLGTPYQAQLFTVIHEDLNGNKYQLRVLYENNFFVPYRPDLIAQRAWQDLSNLNTDVDFFDYLFLNSEFNFDKTDTRSTYQLPPLVSSGGTIKIYFPEFIARVVGLNDGVNQFDITNINVKIIPPESLGKGEFHDALNQKKISSKLDDPIEVINADESTNFFRNGLKTLPSNTSQDPTNYPFWTSDYAKQMNRFSSLLQLTSKERIRLFAKSQNIFSGDFGNYVPYIGRIKNEAYQNIFFMFTKWIYRTAENTIETEMREIGINNPSVNYENSIIFDDEENRLIE